jgi:chromate transporter
MRRHYTAAVNPQPPVSLADATRTWLRIGLLSFGGPAGQIAVMHRILVDEKRWIDEPRFLHALNYCMLLPGPEAQQLATYIGWTLHGIRGGLIAGTLFVLPGFFAVLALSIAYVLWARQPLIEGLFLGLKAAVIAVVIATLVKIAGRALKGTFARLLAAAAFLAIVMFRLPFPLVIFASGALGYLAARRKPVTEQVATPPAPGFGRAVKLLALSGLGCRSPPLLGRRPRSCRRHHRRTRGPRSRPGRPPRRSSRSRRRPGRPHHRGVRGRRPMRRPGRPR